MRRTVLVRCSDLPRSTAPAVRQAVVEGSRDLRGPPPSTVEARRTLLSKASNHRSSPKACGFHLSADSPTTRSLHHPVLHIFQLSRLLRGTRVTGTLRLIHVRIVEPLDLGQRRGGIQAGFPKPATD